MRFSHKDKKDERVSSQSTYAFDYPDKLDQAPLGLGVFVLLNEASDVLYVGCAVKSRFEVALSELKGKSAARDVVSYRWFITNDELSANTLKMDWIEKYQPSNQVL
ncbi:hypothetical protein [Psychromonas algicola]|uniref:hypothetical protein n=1 Tax=Psychromonas algicola TaxID=2555642 RepID=UPI00106888DB|nr:hypothetical protein [Psychromonas sp. RZ5]TEW51437.1 hypothetical protein E2R67_07615 [Psychromonas sp. RZ5]